MNKKKIALEVWLVIVHCLAIALVLFMIFYGAGKITLDGGTQEPQTVSSFDTTVLESWCGQPVGTLRMVGGWAYCEDVVEDETGNLWGFEGLEDEAFYLLWIDDMGTPDFVQDDEIVKVWREN